MRRNRSHSCVLAAAAAAALALTTACAASTSAASSTAAAGPRVVSSGTLTVISDISYPPMEYLDSAGRPAGMDVDLAAGIAKQLGLKLNFTQVGFDDLLANLTAGKADLVMASMTDRAGRQEQVDFVDYFVAGSQIITAKGNPAGLHGAESLCGTTVAVHTGTTNGDLVSAQSALCTAAGRGAITQTDVPNGAGGPEVESGRANATVEDYPSAASMVTTSGALELVGTPLQAAPYGIAVSKQNPALRTAVQQALMTAIADGSYARVLEHSGVAAGVLRTAAINGGA